MNISEERNRDQYLLYMRPSIMPVSEDYHSEMEQFQNITLRPILKMQHDFTQLLLGHNTNFQKQIKSVSDKETYQKVVVNFIRSDAKFRSLLIGAVVGHFTLDESQFYFNNLPDVNKRILTMQAKRYTDTIYKW